MDIQYMYRSNSVQGQIKYSLFSAKTIGLHLKRKQNRTFLHLKNKFFYYFSSQYEFMQHIVTLFRQ